MTEVAEATEIETEATEATEAPGAPVHVPAPAPYPQEPEEEEEKLLDLAALSPTRRLVKLPTAKNPKGETFELRLLDDFGIARQHQLLSWSKRFEQLFNKDEDLTPDEEERLKFCLDSVFEEVLDAPKAVKSKMPDSVRSRVVTGFSIAPLLARQEEQEERAKKDILSVLIKKGLVTQEQVEEVAEEVREQTSGS